MRELAEARLRVGARIRAVVRREAPVLDRLKDLDRQSRKLRYAATDRCPCGAGLAYRPGRDDAWDCSAILLGTAIEDGQPGSVKHTAVLPFVFYEIKSEDQPSAKGATTRPT